MVSQNVCLRPFVTLRAGGNAEHFAVADCVDDLAGLMLEAALKSARTTVLGWGSNVLPSDHGVEGLVILNRAQSITIRDNGDVEAESGCGFQELFVKTAQQGLRGLEFAVGIPGTLGGALVSNAGAYRSSISEFLTELEIVADGVRCWVTPDYMQFSYRDSILRQQPSPRVAILKARMQLPRGESKAIYDEAREYQRQRISKQPPPASAGSFFKNVVDQDLAQSLPGLTDGMRQNGVIPAGFLIEAVGLKGYRLGGAMFGQRHANFILNVGEATATNIRELAQYGARKVHDRFGVCLEEEVLYLGKW